MIKFFGGVKINTFFNIKNAKNIKIFFLRISLTTSYIDLVTFIIIEQNDILIFIIFIIIFLLMVIKH